MENKYEVEAHFYGLVAPAGMWRALGAQGVTGTDMDGPARVHWGSNARNDRHEAYVIELIERARDEYRRSSTGKDVADVDIVRRAIALYGGDRLTRSIQALASSIGSVCVTVKVDRMPGTLQDFLAELTEAMVNKRVG